MYITIYHKRGVHHEFCNGILAEGSIADKIYCLEERGDELMTKTRCLCRLSDCFCVLNQKEAISHYWAEYSIGWLVANQ